MQSLEGQLLIATPDLLAPMFSQSVVLMIDHDEEGAIGVILNKPTNTTMTDLSGKLFDDEFEWDKPLHVGGPVTGTLAVLHTIEAMADREVIPGVYLTLEATKVQHVLSKKPQPSVIVANYSGWGPGQLEGEIDRDSWLTMPASTSTSSGRAAATSGRRPSAPPTPSRCRQCSAFVECRPIPV